MTARSKRIVRGRNLTLFETLKQRLYAISRDQDWLLRARSSLGLLTAKWYQLQFRLMPPKAGRYLICIPRGGLNDVLCQLQCCMYYAIKSRRNLLVNTSDSTIGRLEDIFDARGLPALKTFQQLPDQLKSLDSWPPVDIENLLNRECDRGWDPDIGGFLTFDLGKKYNEPILIHSGRGGGFGLDFLRHLRLVEPVLSRVQAKLLALPQVYDAIQVRNSDIKSDIDAYLDQSNLRDAEIPLLICTDDEQIVRRVSDNLARFRQIIMLRSMREDSSIPLHYDSSISQIDRNTDLISDLIAMAMARRLHLVPQPDGSISGFPRLAKALHAHPRISALLLISSRAKAVD